MRYRSTRAFCNGLLTTTALVAALAGGGRAASAGSAPAASALSGFNVVSGGATLSTPSATKSIITQSTNKAIITWSAFGIPVGSTVQFIQPGASSVALNRVTGNNVTSIMGSLLANGQVWIVNPAGVFFGPGAQVDVAGLMATTSDIKNGDFLSGNYQFGIGSSNPNAAIVNQGTIRTSNGSTVLVGAQVTNQGLIEAQLGSVVLGGAKTFAVDFQGDKLLSFQVTGPVDQTPKNADGTPANALVSNSGTITASGGTVLLTARAAKNVIDNVINSSGIVEATSAKSVNGEIVLDGGATGSVTVSGSLDASGKGAGETGGTVKVLGDQVALAAGANIDVSGDAGGGTALVGGNFHGAGPEQNASTTTISAGSQINASALTSGNGGKVAVWSDTHTTFGGTVTATGGSAGGSGGYVETSGQSLSISSTARVNTSAAKGTAGSWLLDPADFTISNTNRGAITAALTSGNVIVDTVGANGQNGDITVNASLVYASAHDLSLLANGNILVNAAVKNTLVSGSGAINLISGWDGSTGLTAGSSTEFNAGNPGGTPTAQAIDVNALLATPGSFGGTGGIGNGGAIMLGANLVNGSGQIRLLGPTLLTTAVTVDTTNGTATNTGGDVLFASSLASAVTAENLTVRAGMVGNVTFDGVISNLGGVRITGDNVIMNAADTASGPAFHSSSLVITAQGDVLSSLGAISTSGVDDGTGGSQNAGSISITAGGLASIGASGGSYTSLQAQGGRSFAATTTGGNGAAITVVAGTIILPAGVSASGGGVYGTSTGVGGNGGAIALTATGSGGISIGLGVQGVSVLSQGGRSDYGAGGVGGAVRILATGAGAPISIGYGVRSAGGSAGYFSGASGSAGGVVSINSSSGSVSIGQSFGDYQSVNSSGGYGASAGGAGGRITVSGSSVAFGGTVRSDGGFVFNSFGAGNGGAGAAISISATAGGIYLGGILAGVSSRGGDAALGSGGKGGSIAIGGTSAITVLGEIESGGGNVTVANSAGSGGAAGAIQISSSGAVSINNGNSDSVFSGGGNVSGSGSGGRGGTITINGASVDISGPLVSTGGSVTNSTATGSAGNGGAISVVATSGDVSLTSTFATIFSNGGLDLGQGSGGDGGRVTIEGANITLSDPLLANGGAASGAGATGNGGSGGAVSLVATGEVSFTGNPQFDAVFTGGGNATGLGSGGDGGTISIAGSSIVVSGGLVSGGGTVSGATSAGSGGKAGAISLLATSGAVSVDVTPGFTALFAGGGAATGSGSGGHGGTINIQGSGIDISEAVVSQGGAAVGASSTGAGGSAGAVSLNAGSGDIFIAGGNGSIFAQGGAAVGGNAGSGGTVVLNGDNITLLAPLTAVGGAVSGNGGNGGNGGSISVTGTGAVSLGGSGTGNSVVSRGGDVSSPSSTGNGGDAGSISISGASVFVRSIVFARGGQAFGTGNGGHGGAVSITSPGDITLDTAKVAGDAILSRGGDSSLGNGGNAARITVVGASVTTGEDVAARGGDAVLGTLGTTGGGSGGNAAAISITATTGDISIGTSVNSFSNAVGNGTYYDSVVARGGDTDGTLGGGNGAAVVLSAVSGAITAGTGVPAGTILAPTDRGGAITSRGGNDFNSVGGSGGNAGAITVNAGNAVTLGTLTQDENAALNSIVSARGGNAAAGEGGNAGRVSISGASLALSGVYDQGGASAPTLTGGNGGHMTLATTGGTGEVLVLAYTPGSGGAPSLNTDGGLSNGTQTGRAGTIVIDGNVVATEAATLGVGTPTLGLSSQGVGGTPFILVTGSMDASSPGAEALFIDSTGHVTVLGPIGANTPFSSVTVIGH